VGNVEEKVVKTEWKRIRGGQRFKATCPFCNTTVTVYEYCTPEGFHSHTRTKGTRKCKHFYAIRGEGMVFVK
jgi:hypothetical protein